MVAQARVNVHETMGRKNNLTLTLTKQININLPKKGIVGLKLKKCTPQNSGYSDLQKYITNFSSNQQF